MMDTESREMLRKTVRHLLTTTDAAQVPASLDELGWDDVAADDPEAAWGALFEEQGALPCSTAALDALVLPALAGALRTDALPASTLSTASVAKVAVAYPDPRRGAAPTSTLSDGRVVLNGIAVATASRATRWLVPLSCGVALVRADGVQLTPITGIDVDAGWSRVAGSAVVEDVVESADASAAWAQAVRLARLGLGHEIVGNTARMLDIAVEHVKGRVQFGVAIGSFQAVKHRLADVHVALEAARAALHEAWQSGDATVAAVAGSLAAKAHGDASKHCMQVCGGIGFTWEFPLHQHVRRGMLLDVLLGSGKSQRVEIGQRLLRERVSPRLPALHGAEQASPTGRMAPL